MAAKVLDRSAATVPRPLLEAVVEHYDPVELILFGSRARGDAGPDSAWDLLVVTDDDAARPPERPPIWPADATVIPCSRSGFERDRDLVGTLANMADVDGVVVWQREGTPATARRGRRVVGTEERWRVARSWFERAKEDLEVARTFLTLSDRQLANTAFHLQQAAEKILKGLLAASARPFRKSHGLGELAAWVSDLHPDLAPELQDLDPCTSWVGAGRYLDARTDVPITRTRWEPCFGAARRYWPAPKLLRLTGRAPPDGDRQP
jgi:uncharacterized protein